MRRKLAPEIRANGSLNDILIRQSSEIIVESFPTPRLVTLDEKASSFARISYCKTLGALSSNFEGASVFFSRYFSSLRN